MVKEASKALAGNPEADVSDMLRADALDAPVLRRYAPSVVIVFHPEAG